MGVIGFTADDYFCLESISYPTGAIEEFYYENGIADHVTELIGEDALTTVQSWSGERMCRDRDDKDEYKCKINVALAFSNKVNLTEYYHNSSWLEHGGYSRREGRAGENGVQGQSRGPVCGSRRMRADTLGQQAV